MSEIVKTEQSPLISNETNTSPNVLQMLENKWAEGKFLCVGLDVSVDESPSDLFSKAKLITDATKDIAAAFKPNSAFYESSTSEGLEQLESLVAYIKTIAPDVPVIWDAKRADIGKTSEEYARAASELGVNGITLHPYLGGSAIKPLLTDPNRIGFVLGHTSNPGAAEFQHQRLQSGEMLWERVVTNVAHSDEWNHGSVLGVVAGATYPEELAKARHLIGDDVVMLVPGVGTQGGDLEASVRGAMNSRGNGFLINVSSGISGATDEKGQVTEESVREAALGYHRQIRTVWKEEMRNPSPKYGELAITEFDERLAIALYKEDCIRFGDFTLRSGAKSKYYIDLRNSITDPELRHNLTMIYVDLIKEMEKERGEPFDVLAAIPEAVTSYGALVADRMGRRLIQPRSKIKEYGSGDNVLGNFRTGETVGMIDDLITTGGAKLDVIKLVEDHGLSVGGVAILLYRDQTALDTMEAVGVKLKAATSARAVLVALHGSAAISSEHKDILMTELGL